MPETNKKEINLEVIDSMAKATIEEEIKFFKERGFTEEQTEMISDFFLNISMAMSRSFGNVAKVAKLSKVDTMLLFCDWQKIMMEKAKEVKRQIEG